MADREVSGLEHFIFSVFSPFLISQDAAGRIHPRLLATLESDLCMLEEVILSTSFLLSPRKGQIRGRPSLDICFCNVKN